MDSSDWSYAGETTTLSEDNPLSANLDGTAIGIYTLNGAIYAMEDVCPHADALLTTGMVDGDYIECPLHGALFHIPSGKCTRGPAERDLCQFDVRVDGNKIYLRKQPKKETQ